MRPDGKRQGFLRSFGCAFAGVADTFRCERNFKVMLMMAVLAILAGVLLRLTAVEFAVILVCIGVVLAGELVNTAIEHTVDLACDQVHDLARRAKDCGAAAQVVLSLAVALAGIVVYGGAIARLLLIE